MSFIEEVFAKYNSDYEDKLFLLPTRRSVNLFKKKWVKSGNKKATLLPNASTWSDFVNSATPYQTLAQAESIVYLYTCLLEIQPQAVDFKRFVSWAPTVLSDFESIVLQNLKGEEVFQKTYLLQSINRWNLKPNAVKSYMEFWELLPKLYHEFYARLNQLNLQTSAMAFYNALAHKEEWCRHIKEREIVMLGFTVFSPVEVLLLHALEDFFQVRLIYDTPLFPGVEQNHESNRFMAVLQKEFEHVEVVSSSQTFKKIQSIECANSHSMVKKLAQILSKLSSAELSTTAVVLLDDTDAPLLLNSIPPNVTEFNLGMGKPFNQTLPGTLFSVILECWQTIKQKGTIPYQLFETLLRNLSKLNPDVHTRVENTLAQKIKNNVSKIDSNRVVETLNQLNQIKIAEAFAKHQFSIFIDTLAQSQSIDFSILKDIKYSINHVLKTAHISHPEVFEYLFINEWNSANQNIKGSPDKGLQILSLLETRVLDFSHLIFLSFNENNLPGSTNFSYIPFELQIQFGLPDQSAKEAIVAYHFMRLLKRASTATFLYSSKESGISSGEVSRYNLQAKWEWCKNSAEIKYEHKSLVASVKALKRDSLLMPKSEEINEQVEKYLFQRGLSPSALNVYLSNPLDFFLMQVLGLREKDEVDSDIASFNLGEIIHGTLEESYKGYLGKPLNQKVFDEMHQFLNPKIEHQIQKLYGHQIETNAKLKILQPVVRRWLNHFLSFELNRIKKEKFKVIEVERALRTKVLNQQYPVLLKGVIDRVDENPDGTHHVIDYKTGKVEYKDLKLEFTELAELNPEKTKAYQLLLYAYAYWLQNRTNKKIKCSIYSFRNQKSGLIPLLINGNQYLDAKVFQQFDIGLSRVIQEMLDKSIPFEYRTEGYTKFEL